MKLSTTASVNFAIEATRASLAEIPRNPVRLEGMWMHMDMEMTHEGSDSSSVCLSFLIYPSTSVHVTGIVLRNSTLWDEACLEISLPNEWVWKVTSHLGADGLIVVDDIEQI